MMNGKHSFMYRMEKGIVMEFSSLQDLNLNYVNKTSNPNIDNGV